VAGQCGWDIPQSLQLESAIVVHLFLNRGLLYNNIQMSVVALKGYREQAIHL